MGTGPLWTGLVDEVVGQHSRRDNRAIRSKDYRAFLCAVVGYTRREKQISIRQFYGFVGRAAQSVQEIFGKWGVTQSKCISSSLPRKQLQLPLERLIPNKLIGVPARR